MSRLHQAGHCARGIDDVAQVFAAPGRSNDFRRLARKLVLVATDLDSGEAVPFGQPGHDTVPISLAVQASSALPGLYAPVEVQGRTCVDGALKKTLHASVLLDTGLDLLICLNPLVPFDATHAPRHKVLGSGEERIPRLVDGGLPVVLSQTFRSLIHSRLELGLRGYAETHPHTDIWPGTVVFHWPLQVTRANWPGHAVCASTLLQIAPTGMSTPTVVPQTDITPGSVVVCAASAYSTACPRPIDRPSARACAARFWDSRA